MILMIIVIFSSTNKTVKTKQSNRCGVSMRKANALHRLTLFRLIGVLFFYFRKASYTSEDGQNLLKIRCA
jgi:hypothetical protein